MELGTLAITGFAAMEFGNCASTSGKVSVYYATAGNQLILLLCGGNKRMQDSDVNRHVSIGWTGSEGATNERQESR